MNIGVHVFFQTMVFSRYMPKGRISGSYGSSIFSFLKISFFIVEGDHESGYGFPAIVANYMTLGKLFDLCVSQFPWA